MFKLIVIFSLALGPDIDLAQTETVGPFKTQAGCEYFAEHRHKELLAYKYYQKGSGYWKCEQIK